MTGWGEGLSIREISRRTDLPESTLRYYRDVFPDCIPTIGHGRRRRHPESAIPVFRRISRLFDLGASRGIVRRELRRAAEAEEDVGVETGSEAERGQALARSFQGGYGVIGGSDLEELLAAMLARDRELVSMHRELLQVMEGVVRAMTFMGSGAGGSPDRPASGAVFNRQGISAEGSRIGEIDAEELEAEVSGGVSQQLDRLKQDLARERETVERLRHARLELERRLRTLEREEAGEPE